MLSAMDCFCLPSFSEGLPVSILEAMAAGLVVVGSDVSGIREVLENGVTGFLFPSNDDKELAKLLNNIILGKIRIDQSYINSEVIKYDIQVWVEKMEKLFLKKKYET